MCENSPPESNVSVSMKPRRGKRASKKKFSNLRENEASEKLGFAMECLSVDANESSPRPDCSTESICRSPDTTDCTVARNDIPSSSNEIAQSEFVYETLGRQALGTISNDCANCAHSSQSYSNILTDDQREQTTPMKKKRTKKKSSKHIDGTEKEDIKLDNATFFGASTKLPDSTNVDKRIKSITFTNSQYCTKKKARKEKEIFPDYMSVKNVQELLTNQRQDDMRYIKGNIRINPKFFKHAYIAMPNAEADLLIIGMRDRNRALEGDLVVAMINPEKKWHKFDSGGVQKTGTVICILEKVHPRKTVGFLKLIPSKKNSTALFYPRDSRVPILMIDSQFWPENFQTESSSFKEILFLAEIINWNNVSYAYGKIQRTLGNLGDLKIERMAILLENDLDFAPYGEELTEGLPHSDYVPTPADIENREDWRNVCICTIDPSTAKDLDDAVSCKQLDNSNYEIGVHIADVTHYLEAFSPLDEEVSKRATTVYLVDSVNHMLPKQLCEVCSLVPGRDKLTFSVIWEMSPDARVIKHRFAKTIINSCCQMSYEEAQAMIENPLKDWMKDKSLNIKGEYKPSDLYRMVNELYKLSVIMRDARFSNGALRIDQPKLYIVLDEVSRLPVSYGLEEPKESNRLIEEFMLLANMTVATHLYDVLPEAALLRKHQEPLKRILIEVQNMFQMFGVHLNIDSAANLQASLNRYQPGPMSRSDEYQCLEYYRMMVINAHCARAMIRANYICSSSIKDEDDLKHYALNVPLYTHFTSPIRRYPDCVVHRLLYASIQNVPLPPKWTPLLCSKVASNCNKKKYNAKTVQEQSNELYFTYLLELMGPLNTTGIVMDVKDRSMDIILCKIGLKLRLYLSDVEKDATVQYSMKGSMSMITLLWNEPAVTQIINIFSILHVRVDKNPANGRLHGVLLPPKPISV